MKKIVVICGPTATGKTALGIKLAKKFNGEIVSADSRQVYKGMDIGTGKDLQVAKRLHLVQGVTLTKNYQIGFYEINKIKIWLLDIVNPDYQFSVADYVECANLVIKDIWQRGKLPILVGGSGLYIKAVVDGIETLGVAPDWDLRERLRYYDTKILGEILEQTCPERSRRMNESDRNNPRRLIRAIEIARYQSTSEVGGTPPKARGDTSEVKRRNVLFIGLTAPYKILYQRVDERVEERVKQGVDEEIKILLEKGYSWDNSVLGVTIGYKEWQPYMEHRTCNMEHKQLKEEIIQKWKFAEHGYARRQMTWFKKDPRIFWFDITKKGYFDEIEKLVNKWYNPNRSK